MLIENFGRYLRKFVGFLSLKILFSVSLNFFLFETILGGRRTAFSGQQPFYAPHNF
jgi:hypothetical protein